MEAVSRQPAYLIYPPAKGYRETGARKRFSLDNHYDSFYWLFEPEPTPFPAP